jgi:hypothetical protein
MTGAFGREILERLRDEIEVRIETRPAADGPEHLTIIWVVVDDAERALVRSYRGAGARWYREALSGTEVALIVDGDRLPVSVERATDDERVAACSAELERKYAGDPATPAMLRDDVLDTTLELRPA